MKHERLKTLHFYIFAVAVID